MTKTKDVKMPTSSKKKEVSVYVPERKQNRVIKRFSKRKTTLRQFSFVKDWQSPTVEVHRRNDLPQPQKPGKIIASMVSSLPFHANIPTVLSPASLSRVSPSPRVIANSSPKALLSPASLSRVSPSPRVIANSSLKALLSPASLSRVSPSPRVIANSSPKALLSPASLSRVSPSPRDIAQLSPKAQMLSSNGQQRETPANRLPLHSPPSTQRYLRSQLSDQSVITDDQLEAVDERSDLINDQGDRLDVQSEPEDDASDNRLEREDNSKRTVTRALRPSSVQSLLKTPADKSMSIIYRTPVSGPTNRIAAKRQNVSPIQRRGGKQTKKLQSRKVQSNPGPEVSPGSKAKVRLWIGSGRRRTAVDTTDLDIILSKIDTISLEYRQNLSNKQQRKAIVRFNQYVKKDLTDKIDLAQEHKELKSSLSRMTSTTRKRRKELLTLQQRNIRLDMQIAEMKKQTLNKQENDKALGNISTFLTDLQNLQREYVDSRPQDHKKEEYRVTSDNLGVVLSEMKSASHSRYKLRTINNQLQDWIDSH